jgi:hypothetical protein
VNAEKENTFRALRDQDLLVTSKWCKFGFHRWTKWRRHSASPSLEYRNGGYCRKYVFERYCVHCDYVERRSQRLREESSKFEQK